MLDTINLQFSFVLLTYSGANLLCGFRHCNVSLNCKMFFNITVVRLVRVSGDFDDFEHKKRKCAKKTNTIMQCNCNSQVIDFCKNFMCHTRCKKSYFFFSFDFRHLDFVCREDEWHAMHRFSCFWQPFVGLWLIQILCRKEFLLGHYAVHRCFSMDKSGLWSTHMDLQ